MFVHSILPAEHRQSITMEEIHEFGVEQALEKILSHEFQDLLNQEFNFAGLMEYMYAQYARIPKPNQPIPHQLAGLRCRFR